MNKSFVSLSRRAFSLMELIVVISIIGVIAVFTVPQAGQILKGSTLTQGSTILVDQIRLAREFAVTKNCKVEVRFYQYADPEMPGETVSDPNTWQFRAIQVFQVINATQGADVGTYKAERMLPMDKIQMFPQGVIMNPTNTYSSMLNIPGQIPTTGASEPSLLKLPRGVDLNYKYVSFRFLPDGSTNLPQVGYTWFLTMHNMTDRGYLQGVLPYNYFCLQIDPVSGTTKQFRPQAG